MTAHDSLRGVARRGLLQWLRSRAPWRANRARDGAGTTSSAARLELVGHVAAAMAHDLNNLLAVVLNGCESAEQADGGSRLVRESLADIRQAAEDASHLTRYVLAFVRGGASARGPVDLVSLARSTGRVLSRLVGPRVKLVLDLPDAARPVFGRPEQVQQILLNLAVNARDAMPLGGSLTLEVRDVAPSDPILLRRAGPAGPHVLLAITDTGTGMDGRARRELFDPFFTTKPIGRGTGLGLSIVRDIVEEAGGLIEVFTRPGVGTRFELYLPAAEADARRTTDRRGSAP